MTTADKAITISIIPAAPTGPAWTSTVPGITFTNGTPGSYDLKQNTTNFSLTNNIMVLVAGTLPSGVTLTTAGILNYNGSGPVASASGIQFDIQNAPVGGGAAAIGISGANFTVNGVTKFLLGVSYFDIMQWKLADFQYLAANRFNMIRGVLYTWPGGPTVPALTANGTFTGQSTIIAAAQAAAQLGIVIELVVHDWEANPQTTNMHQAVTNSVAAMAPYSNVFFDLVNEHNTAGNPFESHTTTAALMTTAISANPNVIATVSSRGDQAHFYDSSGNVLQGSVVTAEVNTGIKFAQPHCLRSADWASQSGNRVTLLKNHLASIGRVMPIGLFEENRRPLGPTQADFNQAALGAKNAGAAGWLLHNDSNYEMSGSTTFQNRLDSVNQATISGLATHLGL